MARQHIRQKSSLGIQSTTKKHHIGTGNKGGAARPSKTRREIRHYAQGNGQRVVSSPPLANNGSSQHPPRAAANKSHKNRSAPKGRTLGPSQIRQQASRTPSIYAREWLKKGFLDAAREGWLINTSAKRPRQEHIGFEWWGRETAARPEPSRRIKKSFSLS